MLAKRIIPTLLYRGTALVKGKAFNSWRSVGHALQAAKIHATRGVDELVMLDIGATPMNHDPNYALIESLTANAFTPIAVGGGIRNLAQVRRLLNAGADKVVIGSSLQAIKDASEAVGCQAVVAAIDYDATGKVWRQCGLEATGMDVIAMAKLAEGSGAGEIMLTCINREGSLEGYDLETIKRVAEEVDIPVIAHGGCGTYEHMHLAIQAGADAVAAGAMFQFTDQTPKGAAEYLASKGVEVRL